MTQPTATRTTAHASIPGVIAIFLILITGFLSYSNTFYGPFVFDDAQNIAELDGIHLDNFSAPELGKLWETAWEKGRTVSVVSLALNYYFGKLDTFGYHLVNLIIHLLCAISVYLFIKLTLSLPALEQMYGRWSHETALACALLFVCHPIQTQAVSYIVQRMASMVALFFVLSLYFYAKARLTDKKNLFGASLIMALLALGSKQNAITLPFFILIYEYYFFKKFQLSASGKKWLYTIFCLVLLTGLTGALYLNFDFGSLMAGYKQRHFTPGQRLLTQPRVIIFYLNLLLAPLPSRLNLDHDFPLSYSLINPPATLLAIIFILALIAGSVYIAKKRPLISFCLIWFWGNLLLESSFLPLEMVFEHRLYLPSVGFFCLLALCLAKLIYRLKASEQLRQRLQAGALAALVIPLSAMTYQRNKVWQDTITLWEDARGKSPGKTRSNYNLGHVYADAGRLEEAITQYKRTLEIDPGYKDAHNNLANIYIRQGKPEQAIAEHLEEVKHNPDNAKAYNNLGNTYLDQGLKEQALQAYQKAVRIAPDFALGYYGLGSYYEEIKDYRRAAENYQKAIRLNPDFAEARHSLGAIYEKQQDYGKAIELYQQAIQLKPSLIVAYLKLGTLYTNLKYYQRAANIFEQALRLNPDLVDAHYNLGIDYVLMGNPQRAEQHYLTVIRLNPDHHLAHKELGIIYLNSGHSAKALAHLEKSLELAPRQPQADLIRTTIRKLTSPG